jgi:HEAT repeat protein
MNRRTKPPKHLDSVRHAPCIVLMSALLVYGAASVGQAAPGTEAKDEERELYVEVEAFARLDEQAQRQELGWLYRVLLPRIRELDRNALRAPQPSTYPANPKEHTPEELADLILSDKHGRTWLIRQARATATSILAGHREQLKPLLKEDLRGHDEENALHALVIIGELRLHDLFDEVLAVFESERPASERAAWTLRDLRDLKAIPHLIRRSPRLDFPTFELLKDLQRDNRADPTLVEMLNSNDSTLRERAAYALCQSGDPSLIPSIQKLVHDKSKKVRLHVAWMAFHLKPEVFPAVRAAMVQLLSDSDFETRYFVASCFAARKDKVCARPLLAMIRASSSPERHFQDVVMIIRSIRVLTGSDFGYDVGSTEPTRWQPTAANNRAAIERYAEWIEKNAPEQRDL